MSMYSRIVVPLDGSELAERALTTAEEFARLLKAPLHLIRVIDITRLEGRGLSGLAIEYVGPGLLVEAEEATARAYLDAMVTRLESQGLTATSDVRYGFASHEIVAIAAVGDVIVMATHGRSGVKRWFLGSVAEDVIRQAPVPVLLIRVQPGEDASQTIEQDRTTTARGSDRPAEFVAP